jgi:hypothetical protein
MVERVDPERFQNLLDAAQRSSDRRVAIYRQLAGMTVPLKGIGEA